MNKENHINRQLGIWMDHKEAKCIEYHPTENEMHVIDSHGTGHVRHQGESADTIRLGNYRATNNEQHKEHRKENHLHHFFADIAHRADAYDEILVFGPTTAGKEFLKYVQDHKLLKNKTIHYVKSDYMTENQIYAMVREQFKNIS